MELHASAGTRTRVATLGGLHPTPGLLTLLKSHDSTPHNLYSIGIAIT